VEWSRPSLESSKNAAANTKNRPARDMILIEMTPLAGIYIKK
jgi:hypothetical protein